MLMIFSYCVMAMDACGWCKNVNYIIITNDNSDRCYLLSTDYFLIVVLRRL